MSRTADEKELEAGELSNYDNRTQSKTSSSPNWLIEQRIWHSVGNGIGMILTANNGRYRVEVEQKEVEADGSGEQREEVHSGHRQKHKQWMVLRIRNIQHADVGEWKCQVFVRDSRGGKTRMVAESRKRIETEVFKINQTDKTRIDI